MLEEKTLTDVGLYNKKARRFCQDFLVVKIKKRKCLFLSKAKTQDKIKRYCF